MIALGLICQREEEGRLQSREEVTVCVLHAAWLEEMKIRAAARS